MKVFVAGASGAIGVPLVRLLIARGHTVFGMTRSQEGAKHLRTLGAEPVVLDVFDTEELNDTMLKIGPDAVVEELTALPKANTPEARKASAAAHSRVRVEGGRNVQNAAVLAKVRRYVAQSSAFWCEPGSGLANEDTPFARYVDAPAVVAGVGALAEVEARVVATPGITGTILRYGFFYGPGTWYDQASGSVVADVRAARMPIIGTGSGVWSFVHIDDAAAATVAAVESSRPQRSIYNITDDTPLPVGTWLPAYAHFLGAPQPPSITVEDALKTLGKDAVYYGTLLRGASNARARADLKFRPRALEWMKFRS